MAYGRLWRELETGVAQADAEVDDIPEATHFLVKITATLALQVLKQACNIRYVKETDRIPPSVRLSFYAACAAQPNLQLCDMVIRIASWISRDIEHASMKGQTLRVANPVNPTTCSPIAGRSRSQQNAYAAHLKDLVTGLQQLREHTLSADPVGE